MPLQGPAVYAEIGQRSLVLREGSSSALLPGNLAFPGGGDMGPGTSDTEEEGTFPVKAPRVPGGRDP